MAQSPHNANSSDDNNSNRYKLYLGSTLNELRTPLTTSIGFMDLLLRGHFDPLTEQQAENLTFIRKHSAYALYILNLFTTIMNLQSSNPALHRTQFQLTELIQESIDACEIYGRIAPDYVKMEVAQVAIKIDGDRDLLKKALIELLSFIFATTRNVLRISVTATTNTNTAIDITFEDADDQVQLSYITIIRQGNDPFLNIVASIIELHQGTLRFEEEKRPLQRLRIAIE